MFPVPRPLIAAHRGAVGLAPENTIAAFDHAVDAGADLVELDVHLTRDGGLVAVHDVTTTRTTGRAHFVHELTVAQLRSLDAGAGSRIPTLDEVLAWARDRVYLNLDARNYPALDHDRTTETAEAVVDAIERAGVVDQVIVQCLDHQLARAVHARWLAITVGITQHGRLHDPVGVARAAGAQLISGDAAFTTGELVAELHAGGIGLMTSAELRLPGLHDEPHILRATTERLLEAGVDIVVTDDVATTCAVRATSAERAPDGATVPVP